MKFDSIQAGRAVAAMMVVLFHIGAAFSLQKYFDAPIFEQIFRFGASGVDFFFVLSGFIIYYVHVNDLGNRRALPSYVARRLVRVFPSYWIVFVVLWASALVVPAVHEALPRDVSVFIKSLLLVPQAPAVVGGSGAPLVTVAWSMQYEMVFYAVFGLFILSFGIGMTVLLLACLWWTLGAALSPVLIPSFPLEFMHPHYFVIFAIGVVSGGLTLRGRIARPAGWFLAGLVFYGILAGLEIAGVLVKDQAVSMGYGLASGLIVCGLAAWEKLHRSKIPRLLRLMGDSSYVLYLVHFPIISALCKILTGISRGTGWAVFCAVLVFSVCCAASICFHVFIERPIMRGFRHFEAERERMRRMEAC